MKIDRKRVLFADIYVGDKIVEGAYLNEEDKERVCLGYKTIASKAYDSALVLEVANNKYIDLAEIDGAVDYFLLSTAAKLNIDNVFLLDFGYSVEYKHGRGYVKNLREAYKESKMVSLEELIEEAEEIRCNDTGLQND